MYFTSSTLWLCILCHLLEMLLEFHSGWHCLSCPDSASASYNSSELLQRRNPPSQQSSTSSSISRCLRSSSPPPTAKSAGASSPANPITLRLTWFRQRGCTLVASLFTLHVIYIIHRAHGFVPLVSPWKKKCRNFNFHLSSFFKFLFMKHKTKRY